MRWLFIVASIAASTGAAPFAVERAPRSPGQATARPALDNPRVRAYRTTTAALTTIAHGPGVVVSLENGDLGKAVWVEDAAAASGQMPLHGAVVVVQPRGRRPPAAAAGSKPGDALSTGMSFKPLFENDRVSVMRARMDVGAHEGLHTHGSDTIVVHLSGGAIEDTADARTVVNRWTRGDVEFEAVGSSHSARNVGGAVDVVLVVLKP